MRIGLNVLYLLPGVTGGIATYAHGLLSGLSRQGGGHEYVVFTNVESEAWPLPEGPFERVVCPIAATNRLARYAFEQMRLPSILDANHIDVVHSLGYVAPLFPGRPSVVTIPDLNYRHHRVFGGEMPLLRRLVLRAFVRGAALRADHVLTISESSRAEICEHVGVRPEGVTVTYLAAGEEWRQARSQREPKATDEPYAVAFGGGSPNKNIERLVRAYDRARGRGLRHGLVLVGHAPPWAKGLATAGVTFTGYLTPARLLEVVSGADFLVFPSLYEGFGLPVLEAMAAGVPVVSSNRTSLPEVAGDAALFFDPESTDQIADRLCEIAFDPPLRSRLREAGRENERRFSWDRTATETVEVYERVERRTREARNGDRPA